MFTQETNVQNSVLFLGVARETLSDLVMESKLEEKRDLSNYIMREASDFEILHALVYEQFPDPGTKYSVFDEMFLFDFLKEQATASYLEISQLMGTKHLNEFLHEVDTITPYGLSSAVPVLEQASRSNFAHDTSLYWRRVYEGYLTEQIATGGEGPLTGKEKALAAISSQIERWRGELPKLKASVVNNYNTVKKAMASGSDAAIKTAKDAYASAQKAVADKYAQIKDAVVKQGGLRDQIMALKKRAGETATAGVAAGAGVLQKIGQSTGADKMAQSVSKFFRHGRMMTGAGAAQAGGGAVVLGGAALAALLAYGAVKTYKRFFSAAAKACAGKSGGEKTLCMKAARKKAFQAQLSDLSKAASACKNSKDPAKCSKAVAKKVAKIKGKMAKV